MAEYTARSERGMIQHRREVFGTSRLGAPLEVFLPDDTDLSGRSKPVEMLLLAAQHGDEPETTVLLSHALRMVKPEDLQAAVVLAINPDGLARATRGNAAGVDLNRNFSTANWAPDPVVYRWVSDEPRDTTLSPGEAPASEPETQGLLSLVEKLKPRQIVSLHAPLACIDDPLATPLAKWIAEQTQMELVTDIGYPTPGSFGTWAREKAQVLITYELAHQSLEETRKRHLAVILELLKGGPSL